MYVYLQTELKARSLQKLIESEMSGLKVTVFGRVADFSKSIKKKPPDAVLALRPILEHAKLKTTMQGLRGGKGSEEYVVLSPGADFTPSLLTEKKKKIGAVDILGRKGMGPFVGKLLGIGKVKVQRVTKLEDLLPLLQFKAAIAILIPSSEVKGFKSRTEMQFNEFKYPGAQVGLPALAVMTDGAKASFTKSFKGMSKKLLSTIKVDKWKSE